jgi:lysyl-tRNA synthetase class 2
MPSTAIRRFDYDGRARTLDVTFVSGRRYRYFEVDGGVAQGLEAAASKGRFFNENVRDRFAFEVRTGRGPRAVRHRQEGR